jgi:hypothetical protein
MSAFSVPVIRCKTPVLHPNIEGNEICLNILDGSALLYSPVLLTEVVVVRANERLASSSCTDEWNECLRLVDYAHALLWLLYNPNLDSRLNCDCPETQHEFEELARRALCGGTVGGRTYESLLIVPEAPPPPPVSITATATAALMDSTLAASLAARFGLEHLQQQQQQNEKEDCASDELAAGMNEAPTPVPIAV